MMRYAQTADGAQVPILDYTMDEFRHEPPSAIQNLGSLAVLRGIKLMSPRGRRWLGGKSRVLGNLLLRENRFVSGPATYLAKLGPRAHHLSKWDRLAAGSVQSIESARRGYAVAELESRWIAEGAGALEILNIGGGPANDNLNALLLLRRDEPEAFARMGDITIRVLDSDGDGFTLGRNSLGVLNADDGPLAGKHIAMVRVPYDWSQPRALDALVRESTGDLLVCAEGSLFEYGSDEEVLGNLRALGAATSRRVAIVGSAFRRQDEISLVARRLSGISPQMGWKFRGMEGLQNLAAQAGWTIEGSTANNSIYFSFILRPKAR